MYTIHCHSYISIMIIILCKHLVGLDLCVSCLLEIICCISSRLLDISRISVLFVCWLDLVPQTKSNSKLQYLEGFGLLIQVPVFQVPQQLDENFLLVETRECRKWMETENTSFPNPYQGRTLITQSDLFVGKISMFHVEIHYFYGHFQ